MNSSENIKKFLTALAVSFPGDVKPERLKMYHSILLKELEQTNLSWLLDELMKSSDFFPSVKQILDVAKPKEETPRDKAEAFVELMLSGLAASGSINDRVGESNYSFWKKHTGVDRFAIASGAVDPRFMRGTWIDTFERIYKGQNVLQLVERKGELTLAGRIEPTEPA